VNSSTWGAAITAADRADWLDCDRVVFGVPIFSVDQRSLDKVNSSEVF
jgi:hypothetical protein